jgi:hypothetical protein
MGVMGVKNGVGTAKLAKDGPEDSGIQSCLPGGVSNPDTGRLKPAGQLCAGACDHNLLHSTPTKLSG